MDLQKKNLIYRALSFTLAVMFFSLLFSQIFFERGISTFDTEISYIRDTLEEDRLMLSMRGMLNTGYGKETLPEELSERLFKTGADIERLARDEEDSLFLEHVGREWIYLNVELWQKLLAYNRGARDKKSYIIYIYPPDCAECVSHTNLFKKLHEEYGERLWFFILPDTPESGVLQMLKRHYKLENASPAIIVNGRPALGEEPLKQAEAFLREIPWLLSKPEAAL